MMGESTILHYFVFYEYSTAGSLANRLRREKKKHLAGLSVKNLDLCNREELCFGLKIARMYGYSTVCENDDLLDEHRIQQEDGT